jgi:hypothetical protein
MKLSEPGLCPTENFGRNSTEYVGSVTREFISYSFPIWQGLHLENENVQTLTMVNSCESLDLTLKQIVILFQITSNNFIICNIVFKHLVALLHFTYNNISVTMEPFIPSFSFLTTCFGLSWPSGVFSLLKLLYCIE